MREWLLNPERASARNFLGVLPEDAIHATVVDRIKYMEGVKEILKAIMPATALNKKKIRIGPPGDGGYVMLEPGASGLALSLGVSDYSPWDLEMAERGFVVHQYDGTIERSPDCHPGIHFHRYNVDGSSKPAPGTVSMTDILRDSDAGEHDNIILAVDIEGAEWDLLENLDEDVLRRFSQIVIEYHDLHPGSRDFSRYLGILRKMGNTHTPVHVHCNNASFIERMKSGCLGLPDLYEVSYLRTDGNEFGRLAETFPSDLDSVNCGGMPDMALGDLRIL